MAGAQRDSLRDDMDENVRWYREQTRERTRLLKEELERAGRDAWNSATLTGANVVARTPQELRALGAKVLDATRRATETSTKGAGASNVATRPVPVRGQDIEEYEQRPSGPMDVGSGLREAVLQADTAVRGAANLLTFGGADHLAAGLDASIHPGGLAEWRRRYDVEIGRERARNTYDASHRAIAHGVGQLGGTALGLGLVGPMEGALATAPRLAGAAPVTAREGTALLALGAGTGVGMQMISDSAAGGRRSSWGDDVGAALGGVAGVGTLPLGPARAGAIDAAVASAAQDLLNGRPISLEQFGRSAIAGKILGGLAGIAGRTRSNALPTAAKGRLGELLGEVRSRLDLKPRDWTPKSRDPLSKGHWYPDGRSGSLRLEDKFGIGARLSPSQIRAQAELGPNFQLNHFTPADIGKLFGVPAGAAAPHVANRQVPEWVDRRIDRSTH